MEFFSAWGFGIFKTTDAAEARAFADGDPAVRAGLVRPEVFPARLSYLPEGM